MKFLSVYKWTTQFHISDVSLSIVGVIPDYILTLNGYENVNMDDRVSKFCIGLLL